MAPRFLVLFRVLSSSALRAGRDRAIALYCGILIVSVIIFGGPNATRASDVTALAGVSTGARLALWGAWLLAAAPLSRAILIMPSTFLLRSLPPARWEHLAVHGTHLLLSQVPWLALWGRGAGVWTGAAMGAAAVGAEALLAARSRRPIDVAAALGLGALVALGITGPLALPIGLAGAAVGLAAAWRRAPELAVERGRLRLFVPPSLALAAAYVLWLWRVERMLLGRALLATAVGTAAACGGVLNNEVHALGAIRAVFLATMAPMLAVAGTAIGAAALRGERRDERELEALGVEPPARRWAVLLAAAVPSLLLGALAGASLARATGSEGVALVRLALDGAAAAIGLTAAALAVVPRAERKPSSAGWTALAAMGGVALLFSVAGALGGEAPLLVLVPGALLAALLPPGEPAERAAGASPR